MLLDDKNQPLKLDGSDMIPGSPEQHEEGRKLFRDGVSNEEILKHDVPGVIEGWTLEFQGQ